MVKLTRSEEERALRIHGDALVVDTHSDTLLQLMPQRGRGMPPPRRLGERSDRGHIDLPRLVEGGVDCQTFAIYTGRQEGEPWALRTALQMVDIFDRECRANEGMVQVHSYSEILEANRAGRVAALLSIEGAEPLMGDLGVLRVFHRLGVRMLSFTWNWRTPFADGLAAKRAGSRLTDLGVEALRELDRLGVVFDVSHLSDSCFWDVVDVKEGPFVASHSNCRAVCDHPRNLTDDMIRALADHGGVMGMNFAPSFVHPTQATVERVVDHIDHIVDLVGPDHVGLGSDFDGIRSTPEGLEDVSRMPNITRELVKRGYSEGDIVKILGGNFLRVFREVLG
ncbi:MAG: dipeptidase [Candidatus Bathyarchaeia archaeon]